MPTSRIHGLCWQVHDGAMSYQPPQDPHFYGNQPQSGPPAPPPLPPPPYQPYPQEPIRPGPPPWRRGLSGPQAAVWIAVIVVGALIAIPLICCCVPGVIGSMNSPTPTP